MRKQLLLGTALFLSILGGQILPVHAQDNSSELQEDSSSTASEIKVTQKQSSSNSVKQTLRLLNNNETANGAVEDCVYGDVDTETKALKTLSEFSSGEDSETNPPMLEGLVDVLPTDLG